MFVCLRQSHSVLSHLLISYVSRTDTAIMTTTPNLSGLNTIILFTRLILVSLISGLLITKLILRTGEIITTFYIEALISGH
jgi:hypothetical protein